MNLEDAMKWLDNYEEMNKVENENTICYITKEPIKNKIVLKCSHEFEYDALLSHYLTTQKNPSFHGCPYCRTKMDLFIPYYENNNVIKFKPTNSIFKNNYLKCSHTYTKGKKKGTQCECPGQKFLNGVYCFNHRNIRFRMKKENKESKICTQILKNGNPCKCKVFDEESGLCKRHYNLKNKQLKK